MTRDPGPAERLAADYTAAWCARDAGAVAAFFAEDAVFVINRGAPYEGRAAIAEMAAGFIAAYPDLALACDLFRPAGDHALFAWTLEGTNSETGARVVLPGWEEWDLAPDGKIRGSRGWFDAADHDRQVAEGA